jgi:hypothetical protein
MRSTPSRKLIEISFIFIPLINIFVKDTSKQLSKDLLTFDKMFEVMTKDTNKLDLNIPIQYNHITNIKFKTTINTMLDEFADEFDRFSMTNQPVDIDEEDPDEEKGIY